MDPDIPPPPIQTTAESETPRSTRPRWRRHSLRLLAVIVALLAGAIVTLFTVDLGPSLRTRAEKEGSNFMHRPMRIGRLSAKLTPGHFVIEDLVIEGLHPTDRPFLAAKRITVSLPWWTAFSRRLAIESIEMTDWTMVVESFPGSLEYPNGRSSFPKLARDSKGKGPGRFTTTLKSIMASRGQFIYQDHGTPWSTVARNLRVHVVRAADDYRGTASFSNGTIAVQNYEPFRADMQSRFNINGQIVHFDRIDLTSDGAKSVVHGDLDMSRWPEQTYQIKSQIDIPTQKNIFFHRDTFVASGKADFEGTFHLFKGGRELKGTFTSPLAGLNDWRFPDLRGSVVWVPDRMDITNATTGVYGGTARFDYLLAFGRKGLPSHAVWDVQYRDVDLARLTDFIETEGLRLAGRATGRNTLEWDLGKWSHKTGDGEIFAQPPAGVATMTRDLDPLALAHQATVPPDAAPFNPRAALGYLPVAGHVSYTLDPDWIVLGKSWAASPKTYVQFEGRTAYGVRSTIPFHVTSLDWLESDRVLAGIMTAFGSPTGAIEIGGYGVFDGVLLNAFTKPRIEGTFTGERLKAWDVLWGKGRAKVVIENGYAAVSESVLDDGRSEITALGTFSLGYPRRDNGEELNARVRITRRSLADLRHAFELDDYAVEGLVSGEYHLYGRYETPFGFGRITIDEGVAYGEPFEKATASLRFEGKGVRLDALEVQKSTGRVTGAAWVEWEGNYSFNADGTRIPVESLASAAFPQAPLSGLLQFHATGTGTFDVPRYDVRVRVADLFAADEGIGDLSGSLGLRGDLLTLEFEAASNRLALSGSGRIAMTDRMDAEGVFRFHETSLDPYLRLFAPGLSPFTTAVAGGTVRLAGELMDVDHLVVDTCVEQLELKLFDYRLRNDTPPAGVACPIALSLDQHVAKIGRLRLVGEGTQLDVSGSVNMHDSTIAAAASGDANLGILQGFFRNIRSSGGAALKADINGPLAKPVFSGSATVNNGRVRQYSMPSVEAINGTLLFDVDGIRLNDVKAKLGTGDVAFGGRIALNGFVPGEMSVTAVGEQMHLRYPEGFVSVMDADLSLRGTTASPLLAGTVTVHDARYTKRFEATANLFDLTGSGGAALVGAVAPAGVPLRFDVRILAPNSLRVENNIARLVASAELTLQGTYDRPVLFGRADIDRGDVIFEGNRYLITRGSIDFFNPARIEPYFDIEAEARVRVPSQTYRVTLGFTGTANRMSYSLDSDPPLSQVDIISLLLAPNTANLQNAELRTFNAGASARSEEDLLKAAAARLLTGSIAAPVNRVVEQTLGLDLQIAPTLGSSESDALTPSARLILGKRISNRAYLTFARPLGTTSREDQIVVLEYDQSDRVGFVLTSTGDRTFSIDFRVRHVF